jgi:hypothetical protein
MMEEMDSIYILCSCFLILPLLNLNFSSNIASSLLPSNSKFDVYTKFPTDNGGNYYPGFGLNPCVFSLDKIKNKEQIITEANPWTK